MTPTTRLRMALGIVRAGRTPASRRALLTRLRYARLMARDGHRCAYCGRTYGEVRRPDEARAEAKAGRLRLRRDPRRPSDQPVIIDGVTWYRALDYPRRLCLEHRTPQARGGTNRLSNLYLACRGCNSDKGRLTEAEYRVILAARALRGRRRGGPS